MSREALERAVGLIGTGNPAAHLVQCAIAALPDARRALDLVGDASGLLNDGHAALAPLSEAELALLAQLADTAQDTRQAAAVPPPRRRRAPVKRAKKRARI